MRYAGYAMGEQPINELTGARAHHDYIERNMVVGSETLLRALCRSHAPILAAHELAGRRVRWLA
jgi:hypothetical protein